MYLLLSCFSSAGICHRNEVRTFDSRTGIKTYFSIAPVESFTHVFGVFARRSRDVKLRTIQRRPERRGDAVRTWVISPASRVHLRLPWSRLPPVNGVWYWVFFFSYFTFRRRREFIRGNNIATGRAVKNKPSRRDATIRRACVRSIGWARRLHGLNTSQRWIRAIPRYCLSFIVFGPGPKVLNALRP